MFKKKVKNWEQFQHVTEIMKNSSPVQPPENLTADVMARIPESRDVSESYSFSGISSTKLRFGFNDSVTKTECAFYFFLAGFFYMVLGLILVAGFWEVLNLKQWFSWQPFLSVLLASALAVMGLAIHRKDESAVPYARVGLLFCTAFIILNGWIGIMSMNISSAVLFVVIISVSGLGMAFFLGLALDRYHPETIFSEVRG
ncbi:MAG: hypothetical protein QMD11_11830 [Smithella sp.]|nr:hypothetical protein [Smithella sp.]